MDIELTAAQKRTLRSLGRSLRPLLMIGKEGLTPAAAAQAQTLLGKRELIKVKVFEAASEDATVLAEELARQTSSSVAAVVGRTFLLYRPNEELPFDKRVL